MSPKTPERHELKLDLRGNPERLNDEMVLIKLIRDIAHIAGMRILSTNVVNVGEAGCSNPEPCEYGWTACAIISTSHIAIHTWPAAGRYMFDLVSCKAFDATKVRTYLEETLK